MLPVPSSPRPHRAGPTRLLRVLCCVLACACRATPFPVDARLPQVGRPAPELVLGPNDVLRVRVYGYPELSTPEGPGPNVGTRVDAEGLLSLPLVGPVAVGGLTPARAREVVEAAYERYVDDPAVELSVVTFGSRRFYLLGEVEHPGPVVLDRPLTVLQALSYGGSFARFARRDAIALLRREGDKIIVRRLDATRADAVGFEPILPDDVLLVLRTGAGEFSDEVQPYVTAAAQAFGTAASIVLIEDRLAN